MQRLKGFLMSYMGECMLFTAVCFALTSAVYLTWLYRLTAAVSAVQADVISMVIGYLFQAAGTALGVCSFRRSTEPDDVRNLFWMCLILFFLMSLPALLGSAVPVILFFGFVLNLLCGMIAAFYLYIPARYMEKGQAVVFGAGYGIATVLVWFLTILGGRNLLQSQASLIFCFALGVAAALLGVRIFEKMKNSEASATDISKAKNQSGELSSETLYLMGITVFLMSLVKNLGFSFPSTDLAVGVKLELSRLFYGAGLVAAGIISERNRKYGAICTMAALAIPFVMLTITDEPVPRFISWSLDYLFYGFFSVFRVVLFLDVAGRTRQYYLAPLGLAMGRIGDAAGTAFCIGLTGHRIILVAFTTLLFMLTIFFFFRLLHVVYEPAKEHVRSEREIFEAFAIQHDLSMREKEVLRLLLSERSNAEIAGALFVSESTVKYHVHNILQKTGCKSRQDLVKQYTISLFPRLQSS